MKKHTFASGVVMIQVAGQWYRVETDGRVEHFAQGWTINRQPVDPTVAQSVRAMVAVAEETNPDRACMKPLIKMYAAGMFIGYFAPGGYLSFDELDQILELKVGDELTLGTVTYVATGE